MFLKSINLRFFLKNLFKLHRLFIISKKNFEVSNKLFFKLKQKLNIENYNLIMFESKLKETTHMSFKNEEESPCSQLSSHVKFKHKY